MPPSTRAALLRCRMYGDAPSDEKLHRMLFFDWQYTLVGQRSAQGRTMCALAGVKVSYPMLDPAVVDMSLRVPPG